MTVLALGDHIEVINAAIQRYATVAPTLILTGSVAAVMAQLNCEIPARVPPAFARRLQGIRYIVLSDSIEIDRVERVLARAFIALKRRRADRWLQSDEQVAIYLALHELGHLELGVGNEAEDAVISWAFERAREFAKLRKR